MKAGGMLGLLVLSAALFAGRASADEVKITGAGATFPYPIYQTWAHRYEKLTEVKINYQGIGSGGGIKLITQGTVDFGGTDAPLTDKEIDEAGFVQFPMVVGGVVPVANLKGVEAGKLKLTPDVLADILLGHIKNWNHERIKQANPDLALPDQAITVVARSDPSGTTWIYTDYLAKVSKEWKEKVGRSKKPEWPVGQLAKGNPGVAALVQQIEGAIGYVEYAYALQEKMATTLLKNKAGKFASPDLKSFQAAAAHADWKASPAYYVILTDQPGDETWPIAGATFVLVHKKQKDAAKAKAMLTFFDWAYRHGQDAAKELHYVPMPMKVIEMVEETWSKQITADGQPVWP